METEQPPVRDWAMQGQMRPVQSVAARLVSDDPLGRGVVRWLSLAGLLAACTIGGMNYIHDGWLWDRTVTYRPTLMPALVAGALVGGLCARQIIPLRATVFQLTYLLLLLVITAEFVQIALEGGSLFGFAAKYILAGAVFMMWAGMRSIAPLAWLAVAVLTMRNIMVASSAINVWGAATVLLAIGGIVLPLIEQLTAERGKSLLLDFRGEGHHVLSVPARTLGDPA